MKAKIHILVMAQIVSLFIVFSFARAEGLTGTTIAICDDGGEWPPYSYFNRVEGEKTKNVVGFSVDVIQKIFAKHSIKFTVQLIPWKKCQNEVTRAIQYRMLLSASYNAERAKKYHMTQSYYTLNNHSFYSLRKYPNGLIVKDIEDAKTNYKVCGLLGYSYGSLGFKKNEIDRVAKTYEQLIKIMHKRPKRCDLFIEGYEIMAGFKALGEDHLSDPYLKSSTIPGMTPKTYHMMISRKFEYGDELLQIINAGITELEKSGIIDELMKKYDLI